MSSLSRGDIEFEYGNLALPLKRIFGANALEHTPEYEMDDTGRAPYRLRFGDQDPEAVTALLARVQDYVAATALSRLRPELPEGGDENVQPLPPEFFHDEDARRKVREFAQMKEAMRAIEPESGPFAVNPDEAAAALSRATDRAWTMTFSRDGGFPQLRLETEKPIADPERAKAALVQTLGIMERGVAVTPDQRLRMPAKLITKEMLATLNKAHPLLELAGAMWSVSEDFQPVSPSRR